MADQAVDVELPAALSKSQVAWLAVSRVPVRSLRFLAVTPAPPPGNDVETGTGEPSAWTLSERRMMIVTHDLSFAVSALVQYRVTAVGACMWGCGGIRPHAMPAKASGMKMRVCPAVLFTVESQPHTMNLMTHLNMSGRSTIEMRSVAAASHGPSKSASKCASITRADIAMRASGGEGRSRLSFLDLPDALPGSRHTLIELRGLPVHCVPSPGMLLRFTALRRLELVYPLDRALGLPAGLRSLRIDNFDSFKVRSYGSSAEALCPASALATMEPFVVPQSDVLPTGKFV